MGVGMGAIPATTEAATPRPSPAAAAFATPMEHFPPSPAAGPSPPRASPAAALRFSSRKAAAAPSYASPATIAAAAAMGAAPGSRAEGQALHWAAVERQCQDLRLSLGV